MARLTTQYEYKLGRSAKLTLLWLSLISPIFPIYFLYFYFQSFNRIPRKRMNHIYDLYGSCDYKSILYPNEKFYPGCITH